MCSPHCLRCLLTPLHSLTRKKPLPLPVRYLSTTPSAASVPHSWRPKTRGNQQVKTSRPPAKGERKALRKRIVLNNPNALEVASLKDLTVTKVKALDEDAERSVMALPGEVVDQLRTVGAFKPTQRWSSFRKPAILLTTQMVEMATELERVGGPDGLEVVRKVFSGERGTGKSTMLLGAMAVAFLKGWVVISIPECQDLTIAHTDYAPAAAAAPQTTTPVGYIQKTYTATLLSQIASANEPVLSTLRLTKDHSQSLELPLSPNLTLATLAKLGAQDPDIAWPIFEALWDELTSPTRPPLLLALDSINHVMRPSHYRDANFNLIHAHDLLLVRRLLSYLSGAAQLPNGGAVLAATSMSNQPSTPTFGLALSQGEARSMGREMPQPNPFEKLDERVMQVMQDVDVVRLRGLDRKETRALLEYYAASGILREAVDERNVAEKWTLAGGGVVGEVEKVALTRSF
ncbi:MAG: 37S ribosomal protein S23 mitochondrial [Peltula sp. TS41687]|nr:MAG: 37S ribosomal protein S23 mitochondrial [Peltula sp. TS41687]